MCKFCENYTKSEGWEGNDYLIEEDLKINNKPFIGMQVYITEGDELILWVDQGDCCDPYTHKEIKINYCPMCGRKLEHCEL